MSTTSSAVTPANQTQQRNVARTSIADLFTSDESSSESSDSDSGSDSDSDFDDLSDWEEVPEPSELKSKAKVCERAMKREWSKIEKAMERYHELERSLKSAKRSLEVRVSNKRTLTALLESNVEPETYIEVRKRFKESDVAHQKIAMTALVKILSTPGINETRV